MKKLIMAALAVMVMSASTATADDLVVDISGAQSWEFQGDGLNQVLGINLGGAADITGVSWDVNLTTVDPSWASESSFSFIGGDGAVYTPGAGDDFSVANANYVGGGAAAFNDADGLLELEFFEIDFNDFAGDIDSFYEAGSSVTITFTPEGGGVPEPTSIALLSLVGMGLVVRRRR